MSNKKVSDRYAKAIFQIAVEQNQIEEVSNDMNLISRTVNESNDFDNLINSPVVNHDKKSSIFQEIFGENISKLTMDFALLLIKKGRDSIVDDIAHRFVELYNEKNNRLPVKITTAIELDNNSKDNVSKKIHDVTGKTILGNFLIDENIKGGIKVQIDDWVYDATLETQLNDIHEKLIKGENL